MSRGKARRSLELIDACIEILEEIQPATVRAVCYRLFTLGLIDSMSKNNTNRVGRQLTDARERGWLDWAWIVDEARGVEAVSTWQNPSKFADTVTQAYRRNKWDAQGYRVEVWSEKGTVRGTLAPILDQYEVPFRVMHGFASATVVHEVARESLAMLDAAKGFIVLYVGDYDPSGLHMSEVDLPARVRQYRRIVLEAIDEAPVINVPGGGCFDRTSAAFSLDRVALTEDDCADLGADLAFPLETKRNDPRHAWYLNNDQTPALNADGEYTDDPAEAQCWELDALSPVVLRERVEREIRRWINQEVWDRYVQAEAVERESIMATVTAWRGLAMAEVAP